MHRSDDEWTSPTLTSTGLGEGDEIADVEGVSDDLAPGITEPDQAGRHLRERLAAARLHPADGESDLASSDGNRRESSRAAARLLEMAAASADRLVAEARAEADSLVVAARTEAERAAAELAQHRTTVLRELAERQAASEARIRTLRQLESEHRSQLHRHFTEQLAQLEEIAPETPLAAVAD